MTYCPVTFNATRSRRSANTGGNLFQLESSCHVLLPEFSTRQLPSLKSCSRLLCRIECAMKLREITRGTAAQAQRPAAAWSGRLTQPQR